MEINDERFDAASRAVCGRIGTLLRRLPGDVKRAAQEICLRAERPVSVVCAKGLYFLSRTGRLLLAPQGDLLIAEREDIEDTFRNLCSYSIYSHQNEIKNGYITLRGGHRAGICGTAVANEGEVSALRDISSVNIRIAREVNGAAEALLECLGGNTRGGLLLVGAPASGKTTLLRDLARKLSGGSCGSFCKVAVVDERGELAGTFQGAAQNDLGPCCDVLNGYPKGVGIQQAVRTLSPEIIICDELGGAEDVRAVAQGLNAGVTMICTLHAGSVEALLRRPQARELLQTGAFAKVALLKGRGQPGRVAGIYKAGDLLAQGAGGSADDCGGRVGGLWGVA